jgi:hypothetical protein
MVLKVKEKEFNALDHCDIHLRALTAMLARRHWNSAMHARRH